MVVSDDELPAVSDALHAVVEEVKRAGAWVFGGGINENVPPVMVDAERMVRPGTVKA